MVSHLSICSVISARPDIERQSYRETTFHFQRLSMDIQRFNAVAFFSTLETYQTICED